jgi:type IV pilus assembly protein PilY1
MGFHQLKRLLAVGLLVTAPVAHGEDIDLFMGVAPPDTSDLPNVLFIIDNTANWNTAFTNEKAALKAVFDGLPLDKFNIGVMMFGAPDSGYVRAAIRTMNATNRPIYSNWVNGLEQVGDRESARTLSRTMSEAHRYLAGLQSTGAGATHSKRDYTGNTGNATSTPIYGLPGNALSSSSATKYNSPLVPGSCGGTYIIYLGNTVPSGNVVKDNNARNTAARNELAAAGGDISEISLAYSSHQDNVADEWARFLKKSLGVTTYTVDVDPTPMPGGHSNGMGNSALLRSMATQSGGKYFRVDSSVGGGSEIADALNSILNEIQAVNSVFASASLPVSVNTQGTYLNQVFIGMFRPDPKAAPRWKGNLKQYKFLASVQGSGFGLNLVDADEELAINNNTGFLTQCARSFWTPDKTSLDTYWNYPGSEAEGQCSTVAGSIWSNTPDGEVVEKGAAGYQLRATSPGARNVKTCAGCGDGSALTSFDTGNGSISNIALGAVDTTERNNIINWTRGTDIFDEDGDLNVTEMRPSALGDVVHSRPVAVDYGGTTGVVVFYGANDGMLHAVDGNQVGTGAGSELWSFVAPEQYARLKRIYKNDLAITFPSVGDATAKPYFFDGPVSATKDGGTVRIYATQRRGGRMLYAFNVDNPAAPSLLWRRGCTTPLGDDTGCMSGFSDIGQTWSSPKPFKAEGYVAGTTKLPMLIMGGGYDTCEDDEPNSCGSPKGNKVYVLDAANGTLLNTLSTDRSVVGDVTVVPNAATGLADLAYVTDSGGNIYRINIGNAAPAAWTITKIAALGCDTPSCPAGTANRKFLFGPEVVVMAQYPGQYAVLVGSGDREHPLKSNTVTTGVQNAFFMVMDKPTEATWLSDEATPNCDGQSVICLNSLAAIGNTGSDPDPETLDDAKGWYLTLSATEQVVTSAVVLFGEATFSTHMPAAPAPGSCSSNLGIARVYNVSYLNAAAVGSSSSRFDQISGGGLPPSPVSGLVTVENPTTGNPMTVPFIIGASKDSPVEVTLKSGSSGVAGNKERVYWYIEQ